MRILHITAPAPSGGLESVVRALVRGQRAAGHDADVVAIVEPAHTEHPFVADLAADGIEARVVEVPARGYRLERREISRMCASLQPSIVHTHGYRPDVVDSHAAHRAGIPVVTTIHGFTGYGWRGKIYEAVQRRSLRRFDAVVAVSSPIAEALLRSHVPRDRIHTIPNDFDSPMAPLSGARARAELRLPAEAFVLGWVGRLSSEKGPDLFIEALAALRDLDPIACIVGEGPERRALEVRAAALGVADRIVWSGLVRNAGRFFGAFDIFVLSSRTEGTPIVLIEALAAGVPIVATPVGGVPDFLAGRDAELATAVTPAEIAAAVRTVQGRRPAPHRRVAVSSPDAVTASWVAAYDRVYRTVLTQFNHP